MLETTAPLLDVVRQFQVRWVFGNITDALRKQLVTFWLQEGALTNADEAWRRSWEVACILLDEATGSIAGVCTVAIRLDDHDRSYGFVRIFIRPGSRRMGPSVRLMRAMIDGFMALAGEPGAPGRLVATIENRKIERRGAQRGMAMLGFVHVGTAANGELVMQRSLVM